MHGLPQRLYSEWGGHSMAESEAWSKRKIYNLLFALTAEVFWSPFVLHAIFVAFFHRLSSSRAHEFIRLDPHTARIEHAIHVHYINVCISHCCHAVLEKREIISWPINFNSDETPSWDLLYLWVSCRFYVLLCHYTPQDEEALCNLQRIHITIRPLYVTY